MNNYAIGTSTAATATFVAFLFAGHGAREIGNEAYEEVRPRVAFDRVEGSMQSSVKFFDENVRTMDAFATLITNSYQILAKRQQSLPSALAETLANNAWDLYEEA